MAGISSKQPVLHPTEENLMLAVNYNQQNLAMEAD